MAAPAFRRAGAAQRRCTEAERRAGDPGDPGLARAHFGAREPPRRLAAAARAIYAGAPRRPPRDHNLELYGFVQLDAIQDFKRVNPDWDATLRPSRIPTEKGQFGGDGQSIFSVRQSRLGRQGDRHARRQAL